MDKEFLDDTVYLANRRLRLHLQDTESIFAIYKKRGKICFKELFKGDGRNVEFLCEEFVKWLEEHSHKHIIFLHNHPLLEGDSVEELNYASDDDIDVTNWLIGCQFKYDFKMVDHIIIIGSVPNEYYSIRERRLLSLDDRLYFKEITFE